MGQISLCDGKYTVINDIDNGGGLRALVYGTEWRDLTGDSLVLALYQELEDAKAEVERLREQLNHAATALDLRIQDLEYYRRIRLGLE